MLKMSDREFRPGYFMTTFSFLCFEGPVVESLASSLEFPCFLEAIDISIATSAGKESRKAQVVTGAVLQMWKVMKFLAM